MQKSLVNFKSLIIAPAVLLALIVAVVAISSAFQPPVSTDPGDEFNFNFKNTKDAEKILAVLSSYKFRDDIMDASSLSAYKTAKNEAAALLDSADSYGDEGDFLRACSDMATSLQNAARAVDYKKGDIARVYISSVEVQEQSVTNLALGKSVMVSSNENEEYIGEFMTDGNDGTRWSSAYHDSEFAIVDLGEVYDVGYVSINWEFAAGLEYEILLSTDGENWKKVASEDDGEAGVFSYRFDKRAARYVMLQGIKRASEYGYSVYEIVIAEERPRAARQSSLSGAYSPVSITIVDKEGGDYKTITDDNAIIRVRGNSTAGAAKRPFNFKFVESQTPLGLESGKKWCLLANHYDKTLMRNKIAYDFSNTAGSPCYLASRFVEVFIDGKYQGNYILVEPASDGSSRVDIDPLRGEYLVERHGGWSFSGGSYDNSPIYGINFAIQSPSHADGELTTEHRKELAEYWKRADEAVASGDRERIEEILDVNSFVAMYITYELFKDVDMYHGSTYLYIKYGKIHAGPIWDMDLSMGNVSHTCNEDKYRTYNNVSNFNKRSFGDSSDDSATGIWAQIDWYAPLMECKFFYDMVVERYESLIPEIEDIYINGGLIDRYIEEFGASFLRNYTDTDYSLTAEYSPYERTKPDSTYEENVEWLRMWLFKRDMWLREYFGL
jgi:Spore coat assembly protein